VLFIALAISNKLFVLKDNIAFNTTNQATNYKDYSQLNKSTTKL
jgi:hypothetical protein